MRYEPIIGLEVHVQLKTQSKMFCGCRIAREDTPPNTTICPICMGHPGTLPVPNQQAIEWAVRAGMALHCTILPKSKFDRKQYFYPDLPKGYQISQYDTPIGISGYIDLSLPPTETQRPEAHIRITRLHLEEDAAKLIHPVDTSASLVDFNRAGTPLIEIVSEPDLRSALEAKTYLQELRLLMRYLGISDADMEKGHLRADANVSLRKISDDGSMVDTILHPKTEIKNINSFRFVERAIAYEIERQTHLWEEGNPPTVITTRGWDEATQTTKLQRTKEEAHDYRYFPEPDIPWLHVEPIAKNTHLPELPQERRQRFMDECGISFADAKIITEDIALADFSEKVYSEFVAWADASPEIPGRAEEILRQYKNDFGRLVGGWITTKLLGILAAHHSDIRIAKVTPENFAELLTLLYLKKINSTGAQIILEEMLIQGADPSHILEEKKLGQIDNPEILQTTVETVLRNFPKQVAAYQSGKIEILQFLIGMCMKETEGKAEPTRLRTLLEQALQK